MAVEQVPGWEGTVGPFPPDYASPHGYARDVHSGAGNCVCGASPGDSVHVPLNPRAAPPLPGGAYFQEFRPSLWQRICMWRGWPWAIRVIPHEARSYGTQPYLSVVRENDLPIGWHPVDTLAGLTTGVRVGRWAALASVFSPRSYEMHVDRDPEWHEPCRCASPGGEYLGVCDTCGGVRRKGVET